MQFNLQRVKNANYPKKQQKFDQLLSPRLRLVWQCLLRGHNLQVHRCAVGQWSARDSQRASFNLDASKSASFLFCMKPTPPTLRELRNTSEWLKKKTEWRGHSIFQVGVLKVRISLPVGIQQIPWDSNSEVALRTMNLPPFFASQWWITTYTPPLTFPTGPTLRTSRASGTKDGASSHSRCEKK